MTPIDLLIMLIIAVAALLAAVFHNGVVLVYVERKVMADMQDRFGPKLVGPFGLLQTIADAIKLVGKEDTVPKYGDRILFYLTPIMVFIPAFMLLLAVPFTEDWKIINWDIGIYYIFAISTIGPIGIIVAGWASFNKYSLLGGLRSAAQQLSYEVPLLLSVLGVIMLAGSMNLTDIVNAQKGALFGVIPAWFMFLQLPAFVIFLIAALADLNRTPFDLPEGESEIIAGFMTEFSGMRFALFAAAEYTNMFVVACVGVLVFMGGWLGPAFLPPILWFVIKLYILFFLMIWIRATLPRVRIDQLMDLGWKVLLPLTLVNIFVTGIIMLPFIS